MDNAGKIQRYKGLMEEQQKIVDNLEATYDAMYDDIEKAKHQLWDYRIEYETLNKNELIKNLKTGTCYHKKFDKKKEYGYEKTIEFIIIVNKVLKDKIISTSYYRTSSSDNCKYNNYKDNYIYIDCEYSKDKDDFLKYILEIDDNRGEIEIISKEEAREIVLKWIKLDK